MNWQPISTYKLGNWVLVYPGIKIARSESDGYWTDDGCCGLPMTPPTHWMPLPLGPGESPFKPGQLVNVYWQGTLDSPPTATVDRIEGGRVWLREDDWHGTEWMFNLDGSSPDHTEFTIREIAS